MPIGQGGTVFGETACWEGVLRHPTSLRGYVRDETSKKVTADQLRSETPLETSQNAGERYFQLLTSDLPRSVATVTFVTQGFQNVVHHMQKPYSCFNAV